MKPSSTSLLVSLKRPVNNTITKTKVLFYHCSGQVLASLSFQAESARCGFDNLANICFIEARRDHCDRLIIQTGIFPLSQRTNSCYSAVCFWVGEVCFTQVQFNPRPNTKATGINKQLNHVETTSMITQWNTGKPVSFLYKTSPFVLRTHIATQAPIRWSLVLEVIQVLTIVHHNTHCITCHPILFYSYHDEHSITTQLLCSISIPFYDILTIIHVVWPTHSTLFITLSLYFFLVYHLVSLSFCLSPLSHLSLVLSISSTRGMASVFNQGNSR